MTEEQIKAYAVKQFPNDEFKQQIVIDSINWATKELQEEISDLQLGVSIRDEDMGKLQEQIEKMKSDVCSNIKWANMYKDDQMYCKLNAMLNQWELKE